MKKVLGVIIFIAGLVFAMVEGARIQRMNVEKNTQIETGFAQNIPNNIPEKTTKIIPVNERVKKSSLNPSLKSL